MVVFSGKIYTDVGFALFDISESFETCLGPFKIVQLVFFEDFRWFPDAFGDFLFVLGVVFLDLCDLPAGLCVLPLGLWDLAARLLVLPFGLCDFPLRLGVFIACLFDFSTPLGDLLVVLLCFRSPFGFGHFTAVILTNIVFVFFVFL